MAKKKTYDYVFKLNLIGDSDTGKTDLLFRFSDDAFNESFKETIGIDFKVKTIVLDGKTIKLQIWDTAGQERFHTITTSYYRGALGILLVYSITKQKTFDSISKWLRNIKEHASSDVEIVLVGNNFKRDETRQVPREKGEELAALHGIPFIETDTIENTNVEKTFTDLAKAILDKLPEKDAETQAAATVALGTKKDEEDSKCF